MPCDQERLPNIELLEQSSRDVDGVDPASRRLAERVVEICRGNGIRCELVEVRDAGRVGTIELRLAPGVRFESLHRFEEGLARVLHIESVRATRIPGRSTVAVEFQRSEPEVVRLRPLLESQAVTRNRSPVAFPLGLSTAGRPVIADLDRLPHLLIGGRPGSGKTSALAAVVIALLFRNRSDDLRFLMIDPQQIDLAAFAHLPHLLSPIIHQPTLAAEALQSAVAEMERRHEALEAGYGADSSRTSKSAASDRERSDNPRILIVINELTDLVMCAKRATVETLRRIAERGRAVGIHLLCATHRVSSDVLFPSLALGFDARLAFCVKNARESRLILGESGAERLLGPGDALFRPPWRATAQRVQVPLVSNGELVSVLSHLAHGVSEL